MCACVCVYWEDQINHLNSFLKVKYNRVEDSYGAGFQGESVNKT